MSDKQIGFSVLKIIAEATRERNAMLEKVFAKEIGQQSNNVQPKWPGNTQYTRDS